MTKDQNNHSNTEMGSQSNLDIVLATTSRTTGSGAIVLLVNVPRPLFRPALTSKKGWILYKSLVCI